MASSLNGLLLRLPSSSFTAAAGLTGPGFELKPLFTVPGGQQTLGVAAEDRQWYAAMLKESTDGANPWDVVHDAVDRMTADVSLTGAAPDLIEPDLLQPWIHQGVSGADVFGVAEDCHFDDQNSDWPRRPLEFAWHLGDAFSQAANVNDVTQALHLVLNILAVGGKPRPKHRRPERHQI